MIHGIGDPFFFQDSILLPEIRKEMTEIAFHALADEMRVDVGVFP